MKLIIFVNCCLVSSSNSGSFDKMDAYSIAFQKFNSNIINACLNKYFMQKKKTKPYHFP